MQLTNAQQYLVKTNKNLIYHFFLDNDKSLHYTVYADNHTVVESDQLVASIVEFSVTIDKRDKLHLICVNKEGELLYYINTNGKWNHRTISRLDLKSNAYRYLTLYVKGSYTHIIYNKSNLLTPMLSSIEHIYWNQIGLNKCVVANYVHGRYPSPPQISIDSLNNLHLVYKVYYKNNHQLYYSKFNISTKKWSPSELVTNLHEDHSHPYIFVDQKDNLHLAWCSIEQNNFILKYKRKLTITSKKSKWWPIQSLSNRNSNTLSPTLIQDSDILKIYCKQNDQIVEIVSKDFGHSWESFDDNIYKIEDPKIIRYSNSTEVDENLFINHIYGNVHSKIEVAGINLFGNSEAKSTEADIIDQPVNIAAFEPTTAPRTESIEQHVNKPQALVDEPIIKDNLQPVAPSDDIDTPNDSYNSPTPLNQLLADYETIKNMLEEIEGEKQCLSKTIGDCEASLNLLEEKIVDYKKQMLILHEKLSEFSNHNSIFHRFIKFFK